MMDNLMGADRGSSPTPVNLALLDSTLKSGGSRGVDKIQSDFSTLSVSHNTSGVAPSGVQEDQRVCKGKHPPSKRCKLFHSNDDCPTAIVRPVQSVEPFPEVVRKPLNLTATHALSNSEEELEEVLILG